MALATDVPSSVSTLTVILPPASAPLGHCPPTAALIDCFSRVGEPPSQNLVFTSHAESDPRLKSSYSCAPSLGTFARQPNAIDTPLIGILVMAVVISPGVGFGYVANHHLPRKYSSRIGRCTFTCVKLSTKLTCMPAHISPCTCTVKPKAWPVLGNAINLEIFSEIFSGVAPASRYTPDE